MKKTNTLLQFVIKIADTLDKPVFFGQNVFIRYFYMPIWA